MRDDIDTLVGLLLHRSTTGTTLVNNIDIVLV